MTEKKMLFNCRVIDLTDEKGWFCAKLLADMGSEVIRVDAPGPALPCTYHHTGKHSLSLALEKPLGSELFSRLIAQSDVLIESSTPGFLASLRLDYSSLRRINPALIMASITPFGQSGPSAMRKSSVLTASASGGQLFLNGEPDKPPLQPFGPQAYLTAALFAANGILLALRRRRATQQGQHIDVSVQECVAGTLDHALVRYFSLGETAQRQGKFYWNNSFRIFSCRDGFVGLSFLQHWETLVGWLDSEGMAEDLKDARWQDPRERHKNIAHIIDVIEKWAITHSAAELVETGQLMRLPWAQVANPDDILNNPQLKDRGYFVEVKDVLTGKEYQFPGAPVKLSASPWAVDPHLPQLGDFNWEVFHHRLGLAEPEIAQLAAEGII